jgi:hypothetical protein
MGYKPTHADPDVWIRPATKPDGEEYYEYVLVYVDDILCMSHKPHATMEEIAITFKWKGDAVAPPETYLGAKLAKKELNGKDVWTMTSVEYVKAAVDSVEEKLAKEGRKLPSKAKTPTSTSVAPELDDSPELDAEGTQYYQEMMGMLRWAIELGRVDINLEVAQYSTYQASPRRGHNEQVLHIFAFLKGKPKLTLYFDPAPARLDPEIFKDNAGEFREQYRDAKEEMPHKMPAPRGRPIKITAFVDASHAANKVTRRSHTGFIIFINRAPVIWYSKRQNTVESSAFSSEFIAMRVCIEHITALRYKLRMFGVPVDEPADILCDNEAVVNNSSKIESTLHKKHNSIAYHMTRWHVAAEVIRVGWIGTKENLADALTKRLSVVERDYLFGNWTY